MKSPRVNLVIDRDKAAAVGLNATQIAERALRRLRPAVVVDDLRRRQRSTACCSSSIRSTSSTPTRWTRSRSRRRAARWCRSSRWSTFKETVGPQTVNHSGQLPAVSISFGLRPGVSLGAAIDHDQRRSAERMLPADGHDRASRARPRCSRSRCSNLGLLLFVAIGVVYIVLGVLYESYIHPLTILSGLPSAGLGALRHAAGCSATS